jgi:hypothetical protein
MDLRWQALGCVVLLLVLGPAWFFGSFVGIPVLIFVVITVVIAAHLIRGDR